MKKFIVKTRFGNEIEIEAMAFFVSTDGFLTFCRDGKNVFHAFNRELWFEVWEKEG